MLQMSPRNDIWIARSKGLKNGLISMINHEAPLILKNGHNVVRCTYCLVLGPFFLQMLWDPQPFTYTTRRNGFYCGKICKLLKGTNSRVRNTL
jgi:hypothetical protein